ncbi:hypothetical protein APB26_31760 [Pseudomonas aeruginosa]|uniref:hypothetical protein n=1 Tax=Pseudomonas aeruginosa TaxID=287 RepID=UPI00071B0A68|nr:hypothetical protein [Pseudomonas aeruginosa]KSQ21566.1 hypothetical protein APB26_31760 [Pseudomonas aeruginosa]RPV61234.1 hypothetical protein IPC838_18085 [Pseudomonas aeruginosa]
MNHPIIVNMHSIGVDRYFASDDEAEMVMVGLTNYGFLLKHNNLQTRRVSFGAFADCIEANCDLTTSQTAAVVHTLRVVHERQKTATVIQ